MSVADSRISSVNGVLTEHGPKILPINVTGRWPDRSGDFNLVGFQFEIGFSYSGATLPALSTHNLANTLLGKLAGRFRSRPPSLQEIADFVRKVALRYMREVGEISGNNSLFTAIVFGFCHVTSQFRSFEIRPRFDSSKLVCELIEHSVEQSGAIVVIGSCTEIFMNRIQSDKEYRESRDEENSIRAMYRPAHILQALIKEKAHDSVGGMIQMGSATCGGFQLESVGCHISRQLPSSRNMGLFVLGFDTVDIQGIGESFIAFEGKWVG